MIVVDPGKTGLNDSRWEGREQRECGGKHVRQEAWRTILVMLVKTIVYVMFVNRGR